MRMYEGILLVFGGMVGFTWALVALVVGMRLDGPLPGIVNFTLLLPLTTMFLLGAWLPRLPVDALVLLFAAGLVYGVLLAGVCTVYVRLRGW
jgi:hypothetical protein